MSNRLAYRFIKAVILAIIKKKGVVHMTIKKGDRSFYVENENHERIAYIEYSFDNETTLIANSTYVNPSLRGQGIARKLLDRLANYARDNNYRIRPLCSYVVHAFEQSDEYDDVKIKSKKDAD